MQKDNVSQPHKATRDGYGEGVVKAGRKNRNVVVLTADLAESTRSRLFAQEFPDRFIEVGVAEQNLMGIGAGLALAGKVPFVASYAVFSPGRSWDQLRVSVCYSQANVKIIGGHTGLTVGEDGATHQALEDIAMTRVLPNLTVIYPCDALEAEKATVASAEYVGPVYIRLSRFPSPLITTRDTPFEVGRAQVMKKGKDVTLIASGPLLGKVLQAAAVLAKKNVSAEVINLHTIKPLDEKTLLTSLNKTKAVVTVEEHQMYGGVGSTVAEFTAQNCPVPIEFVGMPDHFGESGKPEELLIKYGMDVPHIVHAALKAFHRKHLD